MSVTLSKTLLATPEMTKKEKLKVMKARQSALSHVALELLTEAGYSLGPSLKVPGAYAFKAKRNGKDTTIGVKTSADRWVGVPRSEAGGWGLLGAVEEVFVVTFDDRYAPKRLQLIAFDPKKVIAMGEQVYAKAGGSKQTGLQWIPLDEYENRHATSMAAGPLLPHGKLIFEDDIVWTSPPRGSAAPVPIVPAGSPPTAAGSTVALRLTIQEAKAGLALNYGVSPDAVKILIEG